MSWSRSTPLHVGLPLPQSSPSPLFISMSFQCSRHRSIDRLTVATCPSRRQRTPEGRRGTDIVCPPETSPGLWNSFHSSARIPNFQSLQVRGTRSALHRTVCTVTCPRSTLMDVRSNLLALTSTEMVETAAMRPQRPEQTGCIPCISVKLRQYTPSHTPCAR